MFAFSHTYRDTYCIVKTQIHIATIITPLAVSQENGRAIKNIHEDMHPKIIYTYPPCTHNS